MGQEKLTVEEISQQILLLAKSRLTVELRFLCKAFEKLSMCPSKEIGGSMATDGKTLYYVPRKLLQTFKERQHMPARVMLHLTLHCLLGHLFRRQGKDECLWDLACDVAVENIIRLLDVPSCNLEEDGQQHEWLFLLGECCSHMTVEELYDYFVRRGLNEPETEELTRLFCKDSHSLWGREEKRYGGGKNAESGQMPSGYDDGVQREEKEESGRPQENNAVMQASEDDRTEETLRQRRQNAMQKEWTEIARQAEIDLHVFSKQYGQCAGALMDGLLSVTFEVCDYGDFLRRFGARHEVMQVSQEEFDMIYYTYGLRKYGNIPLIEPLEFRDDRRIREFVIAIDTSMSVQGDIVRNFLQKTCNVLRQTDSFTEAVKIYLIQCDAQIQNVEEIVSLDGLEDVIKGLKLSGFGGTDFRPVFDYVDCLIENGALGNLNGLLYFTDGIGAYPEKKPAYQAAFIFNRDDYISPNVPYWAIKAVLTTDNIKVLNAEG